MSRNTYCIEKHPIKIYQLKIAINSHKVHITCQEFEYSKTCNIFLGGNLHQPT